MSVVVLGLFFLACGWKFYKDFKCTRYLALKNSGHPQYFGGALCAVLIFVICLCFDTALGQIGFYQSTAENILQYFPVISDKAAHPATLRLMRIALLALPVVVILTKLLNAPLHKSPALLLAVAKKTRIVDELEDTLYYCLDRDLFVLITLKSRKVYVGIPKRHSPDPDRDRVWLAIWPISSGFRKEDGSIEFNTFYPDFERLSRETYGQRVRSDFQLVIPLSEVASAQSFDFASFNRFSNESEVLAKSPDQTPSRKLASDQANEVTEGENVEVESEPPAAIADQSREASIVIGLPSISAEIVDTKDKYHLRCYEYYLLSLFLWAFMLPSHPITSSLFLPVAAVAAFEAVAPMGPKWNGFYEKLALLAATPLAFLSSAKGLNKFFMRVRKGIDGAAARRDAGTPRPPDPGSTPCPSTSTSPSN